MIVRCEKLMIVLVMYLTHPPCVDIQVSRWFWIYWATHSFIESTKCSICLSTHSSAIAPPNTNRATILPQFLPSMNNSFATARNVGYAISGFIFNCCTMLSNSSWYLSSKLSANFFNEWWTLLLRLFRGGQFCHENPCFRSRYSK